MTTSTRQKTGSQRSRFARAIALAIGIGVAAPTVAHADATSASSDVHSITIDDANRAFGEGRYAEAETDFRALLQMHGDSVPLLFDLGNAELRQGKSVPAILSYKRGLLLDPRDPALAANLAVAERSASVADSRSAVQRTARVLSMDAWSALAVLGFWLAAGLALASVLAKKTNGATVAGGLLAAATCVASCAALVVAHGDLRAGLVMQSAPVLVSPFGSAASDFALPAGADVELGAARDGFVFVTDGRDRSGWVEAKAIEALIPPAA